MSIQDLAERERLLREKLNKAVAQYRMAVRWLKDARIYYNAYSQELTFDGKVWKGNSEGELAKDSQKAYNEAISTVLYWRKKIDSINKSLVDLAGKRKTNDK